jgi:signal transduction histidine kinase
MVWSSVRVRLTLWNICVLAFVLGGFGFAFCYAVQANQSAAIKLDLRMRARPFTDDHFPGGPVGPGEPGRRGGPRGFGGSIGFGPGGPGGGLTRGFWVGRGPGDWEHSQEFVGPPTPGRLRVFFRDWRGMGPKPPDAEERARSGSRVRSTVELEADRRRFRLGPRLFDLQGKSLGPFGPEADPPWDRAAFAAAAKGKELFTVVVVDDERVQVYSAPMTQEGKVEGVVQIPHSLTELDRLLENQYRTLLLLIPAALLVAGIGGLFLTSHALRPVRKVTQAAAQIGAEDLSQRLEVTGKDELAELAGTFNGMIARLEGAFQSREQAYRQLESAYQEQRRFTADASHELRTPLARIKGITSLALFGPHCADEYHDALTIADQAADVMNRIVQDLLLLARSDAGQLSPRFAPVSVERLLLGAADRLHGQPGAPIRVELPAERLELRGDADHLTRLLVNLLENAVRHTPEDGEVLLSACREGSATLLTVSDNGEGIPAEHLPHLCERFYRVDASRTRADGGTGLGLAICQSIVQAHEGSLSIRSRPGLGTTVEVRLPGLVAPELPATPAEVCA